MNQTFIDLLLGTTSMLTFAMSVMVIALLFMVMRNNRGYARKVYKDWILFTGTSMTVTSLIFQAFGVPYLNSYGFISSQIDLLLIYNNFIRFIGASFVFTWVAIFEVFSIQEQIKQWFKKTEKTELK